MYFRTVSLATVFAAAFATGTMAQQTEISAQVIENIYNEIKTPYPYGVVIRGSQLPQYDYSFTSPSVFKIHGDDNHVYQTLVGWEVNVGYRTVLYRSNDWVTWEQLGVILNTIDHPHQEWDKANSGGYLCRSVEWGTAPVPHVVSIDSPYKGMYLMPYFASDTRGAEAGNKKNGMAYSDRFFNDDGTLTQWKSMDQPFNYPTEPYEKGIVWKCEVIWDEGNSRYVAFYNTGQHPEVMAQAYSPDLVHWTKEPANPVLDASTDPATGQVWGSSHNADADVKKIGDYWVMTYFTNSPHGIIDAFAVSTDMVHWTKSYKPLLSRDQPYNSLYAHKASMAKHNGVVYHYYTAAPTDHQNWALQTTALNTSVDLSVIRRAQAVDSKTCSEKAYKQIQTKLRRLQHELVRNGGSLEEVQAAIAELQKALK